MSTIRLAVFAHDGSQPTVFRHHPLWKAVDPKYTIFAPAGFDIELAQPVVTLWEADGRHRGPNCVKRWKSLMDCWIKSPRSDYYMVCEYDSFCWPALTWELFGTALWGCWAPPNQNGPLLNAPWLFKGSCLVRLRKAMDRTTNDAVDRTITDAAILSGIPLMPMPGLGAAGGIFHNAQVEIVRTIAERGGRFFHGVKTPEILNAILEVQHE